MISKPVLVSSQGHSVGICISSCTGKSRQSELPPSACCVEEPSKDQSGGVSSSVADLAAFAVLVDNHLTKYIHMFSFISPKN